MAALDPASGPGKISLDRRINLGALINVAALLLHLFVLVAGGLWMVAVMDAKVDGLTSGLASFKADVTTQLNALRSDLSANTSRLDSRVDNLRDARR